MQFGIKSIARPFIFYELANYFNALFSFVYWIELQLHSHTQLFLINLHKKVSLFQTNKKKSSHNKNSLCKPVAMDTHINEHTFI